MSKRGNDYLTVADNFFGQELNTPKMVQEAFSKLSLAQRADIVERYVEFEESSVLSRNDDDHPLFHIGKAYETFEHPKSWHPRHASASRHLTASAIVRALMYMPRLSIWWPTSLLGREFLSGEGWTEDNYEAAQAGASFNAEFRLMILSQIRPFVEDGTVQLVSDRTHGGFYDPTDATFAQNLQLNAELEGANPAIRAFLKPLERIEGVHMSERREAFVWRNRDRILYVEPMLEINEDIIVQSMLGAHMLSSTQTMHDVMKLKLSAESKSTKEMFWMNNSVHLPKLSQGSVEDLISIRRSEDAFENWRTTLATSIRTCQTYQSSREMSGTDVAEIFNETVSPVSRSLGTKLKSKTIKSALEGGVVSFASGAIAASALSPTPTAAIGTGAITASLKITYDALKAKGKPADHALFRMFTLLKNL